MGGGDLCLYAWLVGRLFKKNLRYLSQNLIINPEIIHDKFRRRIRFYLYKLALRSDDFEVTVNAPDLIEFYSKTFDCPSDKFHLVYDSMDISEGKQNVNKEKHISNHPYVFFGGKAFRDTYTFVKIVETLPNVRFKAVILKDMVIPQMRKLKNLEVICNVGRETFYEILNDAAICCIPLDAMVPCGVSVMQCAILMNVPIVSTDTPSMRTIVPNDEFGFLLPKGDYMGMSQRIEQLLSNELLYKGIVARANENMKNFSPEVVANQLCDVIDNMRPLQNPLKNLVM